MTLKKFGVAQLLSNIIEIPRTAVKSNILDLSNDNLQKIENTIQPNDREVDILAQEIGALSVHTKIASRLK